MVSQGPCLETHAMTLQTTVGTWVQVLRTVWGCDHQAEVQIDALQDPNHLRPSSQSRKFIVYGNMLSKTVRLWNQCYTNMHEMPGLLSFASQSVQGTTHRPQLQSLLLSPVLGARVMHSRLVFIMSWSCVCRLAARIKVFPPRRW